jgi:tetratricopeptide (TPR) repeat protein
LQRDYYYHPGKKEGYCPADAALLQLQSGDLRAAKHSALIALQLQTNSASAWLAQGRIQLAAGETNAAVESLGKAAGLNHLPEAQWILSDALREMGVGSNGGAVAVPLLGFNSGVEIGQMMIAAVILPVLWQFKDKPQFTLRWAPVCSAAVALAGGFWFVQRVWMN